MRLVSPLPVDGCPLAPRAGLTGSRRPASVRPVLQELRLTGLGVIDEAVLEPDAGFTVVTGETGAGKTMIVTALGLIGGGRGAAARVRSGSDRAVVEARFALDGTDATVDQIRAVGGRLDEDGTMIAVRSVGADGRSRAYAGGRAVPLGTLAELMEPLVTVHGQSEAISLLRPSRQRSVLDRFADVADVLDRYRELRASWHRARDDLSERVGKAQERALREQMLRLALAEIAEVAPQPAEDVALVEQVRRLENADSLRSAAAAALAALVGVETLSDAPTAVHLAVQARRDLEATGDPRLRLIAESVGQATAVLGDAASEVSGFLGELDHDPGRLEQALSRQAALRALTRRYGPDVDAVLAWVAQAEAELDSLDSSETRLTELRARVDELRGAVADAAAEISLRRRRAGEALGGLVTAELEHLAMGRAVVRVSVEQRVTEPSDPEALPVDGRWLVAGADGVDQVEILMRTHPAGPELPVSKGASGGELSRVMLALEVALTGSDPVATLVFDEVDAGVGGRAATEIGSRLSALSRSYQVICVTHLAQVAAYADRHFVVQPAAGGLVGRSGVREVTGHARETELARMLGGTDGPAARAHARDLLAAAEPRSTRRAG